MFGSSEILLILVFVLLFFGGKELPRLARTLGKWFSVINKSSTEIRREIMRISIEEELKEKGKSLLDPDVVSRKPTSITEEPPGKENTDDGLADQLEQSEEFKKNRESTSAHLEEIKQRALKKKEEYEEQGNITHSKKPSKLDDPPTSNSQRNQPDGTVSRGSTKRSEQNSEDSIS
ncbi:twin-arginine translocase TatA/TatE family subunit [bacterium]|nr:twin-arginine translocase TatA/TatE family subunit [bacterium]